MLDGDLAAAWRCLASSADLLTGLGSSEIASYWLESAAAALLDEGDTPAAAT